MVLEEVFFLTSHLVTDLKNKEEETVLKLNKLSLEENYHTPESSIPGLPPILHHSSQSKASGTREQGDIQYVPPLASQGMLSPVAEAPSPDVELSPAIQAVYYPLQHILHPLDPVCGWECACVRVFVHANECMRKG